MTKCDITIEKTMTINTGDFSSVKPRISMTLHDIDVGDVARKSETLSEVLENLLTIEIIKLVGNDRDLKKYGIDNYYTMISKKIDDIQADTELSIQELL